MYDNQTISDLTLGVDTHLDNHVAVLVNGIVQVIDTL
ncbi:hypothetical protein N482_05880 [Pseudoalteromonas luteoviolacea NCIMB 1942]|uniref:Uncharacterized protein n=1 Tax=Pseudoalteromonas luteoviolacea NCIMB 1942 TaxID=1365253 RepID=A0A167FIT8_9GAMM|nr:hypothetical protein N482_05880 [Pseudoalteromonas luteoviolacea NCIMB 1942]